MIGYRNNIKSILLDLDEEIIFAAHTYIYRKPTLGKIKVGYTDENMLPIEIENNYKEGEVVFLDDFNKILPHFNNYLAQHMGDLIEKEKNIFELVKGELQTNEEFQQAIADMIETMKYNGDWKL